MSPVSYFPAQLDHLTTANAALFKPLDLPCGITVKDRIVKSAMSDALGDGTCHPTDAQSHHYSAWTNGGVATFIIAEMPGARTTLKSRGSLF